MSILRDPLQFLVSRTGITTALQTVKLFLFWAVYDLQDYHGQIIIVQLAVAKFVAMPVCRKKHTNGAKKHFERVGLAEPLKHVGYFMVDIGIVRVRSSTSSPIETHIIHNYNQAFRFCWRGSHNYFGILILLFMLYLPRIKQHSVIVQALWGRHIMRETYHQRMIRYRRRVLLTACTYNPTGRR